MPECISFEQQCSSSVSLVVDNAWMLWRSTMQGTPFVVRVLRPGTGGWEVVCPPINHIIVIIKTSHLIMETNSPDTAAIRQHSGWTIKVAGDIMECEASIGLYEPFLHYRPAVCKLRLLFFVILFMLSYKTKSNPRTSVCVQAYRPL